MTERKSIIIMSKGCVEKTNVRPKRTGNDEGFPYEEDEKDYSSDRFVQG